MTFKQKLDKIIKTNNSLVCVGLDSDVEKIPTHLNENQFEFNKEIIDATHDLVCAYKPNTAFYDRHGVGGLQNLEKTIKYITNTYPDILVILDTKRADIGNTNKGYVAYAFDWLNADAMTVHPYLGKEAMMPFLDRKDKMIFILCRTSNPGAGEYQDLVLTRLHSLDSSSETLVKRETLTKEDNISDGRPLYQLVAENVARNWNQDSNCGLVVGATYPEELNIVRRLIGDMPLLVPGIGAQGGDIEKTVKAGLDSNNAGMIINSSRGIIFAGRDKDFAQKAREKTIQLRDQINQYR